MKFIKSRFCKTSSQDNHWYHRNRGMLVRRYTITRKSQTIKGFTKVSWTFTDRIFYGSYAAGKSL